MESQLASLQADLIKFREADIASKKEQNDTVNTLKVELERMKECEIKLKEEIEDLVKNEHPMGPIVYKEDNVLNMQKKSLDSALKNAYESNFQRTHESQASMMKSVAMDSCSSSESFAAALQLNQPRVSENVINWFSSQGFIGYQLCAILSQQWLIDKACSTPARDAIRNGYDITINDGTNADPEFIADLKKKDEEFGINDHCVQLIKFSKIFGVRVCLFTVETDDPVEYYANPFNIDGVRPGSYKGIAQIDPYWINAETNNVSKAADPDFYVPEYWSLQGLRIHKSHLVVIVPSEVPDILKPTYYFGGIPLTQKIYERVYAAERTANEAPMLALSKRLNVVKTDMDAIVSDPNAFVQKMNNAAWMRDNYGTRVVGTEDEIQQFDTALADLDSVIMTQYQLVSAIANVPISKLLGTQLKGFGSTGEYEENNYHEEISSLQESDLTPFIQRHHDLIIASYFPEKKGMETKIVWRPLNVPTDLEIAEINKVKSETDLNLVNSGGISSSDINARIIADETSGYNGIADIDDEGDIAEEPPADDEERELDRQIKELMGNGQDL